MTVDDCMLIVKRRLNEAEKSGRHAEAMELMETYMETRRKFWNDMPDEYKKAIWRAKFPGLTEQEFEAACISDRPRPK